jgi:antagonist of KipI
MSLKIHRPGIFTTVQDLGRWGHQSRGVPVSGAMDVYSHRLANRMVGNADDAATLEITLVGPELEFEAPATIAVTGAEFRLTLDGAAVAMSTPHRVREGSRLKFGERIRGARAYLAVAGGIDVPSVLGSRSTHVVTRMGGLDGRPLRGGDVLKKGTGVSSEDPGGKGARPLFLPEGGATLRVLPGTLGVERLVAHRYTVSPRSDRMGYRLDGAPAFETATAEQISAPVGLGAVQVPPSGEPILLMADHATSGGYAIAATVISADLPLAGQLAPGDWLAFRPCSLEEADAALRDREADLGRA